MANIHMVLQGKGGVGKSVIAALLAQYMARAEEYPVCIDTDPVNATFHGYKALKVRHIEIMNDDESIDPRMFDDLIGIVAESETDVIIDNGASSFIELASYLVKTEIPALLQSMGHEMIIHTVITGGQAMNDTIKGFAQVITQFPDEVRFVVWLNPYWGPVQMEGKDFEDFKVYRDNFEKIHAVIRLPDLKKETFGRDFGDMLQRKLTFEEALNTSKLSIVTRQRLTMIRRDIFKRLEESGAIA